MKILITGAAGDVGSRVVAALLERGHKIKTLVRRVEGSEWLRKAGAEIHIGDVTKPETLSGICDDMLRMLPRQRRNSAFNQSIPLSMKVLRHFD